MFSYLRDKACFLSDMSIEQIKEDNQMAALRYIKLTLGLFRSREVIIETGSGATHEYCGNPSCDGHVTCIEMSSVTLSLSIPVA